MGQNPVKYILLIVHEFWRKKKLTHLIHHFKSGWCVFRPLYESQEINIKLRVLNELFLEGITDMKKMHRNDKFDMTWQLMF